MSILIGMGGSVTGMFGNTLIASDERNLPLYHQWAFCILRPSQAQFADGVLWASSRGLGGQLSGSITGDATSCSGIFELYPGFDESGGQQIKKIIGTTLDSTGAPLGSCLVQGFVTATDVFVGQVTSDTAGYYELTTSFSGQQHYVVAYKAGSPDVSGTSLNTLVPA